MASALRITGGSLLIVAVVLSLVALALPTGEAWVETSTGAGITRTTETYDWFGLTIEREVQGPSAESEGTWSDAGYDESGGITYLRAAPAFLISGLILAGVAALLTLLPSTRHSIAGGIIATLGVVGGILGTVLHVSGLQLHVEGVFKQNDIMAVQISIIIVILALILMFAATVLGYIPVRRDGQDDVAAPKASPPKAAQPTGPGRLMKCPSCATANHVPYGAAPTCASCGFS